VWKIVLYFITFYLLIGVLVAVGSIRYVQKEYNVAEKKELAIIAIEAILFWLVAFISLVIDIWRERNGKD